MSETSPAGEWSGGDPDDLAAWTLVRAYHHVGRRFYAALAPFGLTPQQFGVLIELTRRPGLSQAALARAVLATPQSIGELVHAMVEQELLHREAPDGRGHPARLSVGVEGARRLEAATPHVLEAVSPAALGLTDDEEGTLNALLHRVIASGG